MPGIVTLCRPEQTAQTAGAKVVIMITVTRPLACFLALACVVPLRAQAPTAQTSTSSPPTSQTPAAPKPTSEVPTTPPPVRIPPQQHLTEAQRLLDGVSDKSFPEYGAKVFTQLKKDMSALEANYGATEPKASAWTTNMSDVERGLALLIGGGNGLTAVPSEDKGKISKVEPTDPATRTALQEIRTHVELFYDAATTGLSATTTPAPAP
jgi:hypothetical protein